MKFIRLKNNDDIISDITKENDGKVYVLNNPLKIYYQYTTFESFYIVLIPWVSSSISPSQIFPISFSEILTISDPSDKLKSLYQKSVKYYDENKKEEQDIFNDPLTDLNDEERKKVSNDVKKFLKNLGKKQK